ncbi:MAG: hypothetical protein KDE56_33630, partial [Anaerolineales bacterium]|nr:hypothetical protein [Anaerolineales bacterium]
MKTINKQMGQALQLTGLLLLLLLGSVQLASADVVTIERVSISDIHGIEVGTDGNKASISSDGRFIA